MSASTTRLIFGIRIYLDAEKTQDEDIGLYTADNKSQFRWLLNDTTNTTDAWKSGMILEGGIGKIPKGANFVIGGNTAFAKPTEVSVRNNLGTVPFWKKLSDSGISLAGCIAEIVEVDTEVAHADTRANETIIFRGACVAPSGWTEGRYTIPVEPTHYKRVANITAKVDNNPTNGNYPNADDSASGISVPATFGRVDKARFARLNANDVPWNTGDTINGVQHSADSTCYPIGLDTFPITFISSDKLTFSFRYTIANSITDSDGAISSAIEWMIANNRYQYLKVVVGEGSGQYRKISSISIDEGEGSKNNWITVTIADYFESDLTAATVGESMRSWVQLVDIQTDFIADEWTCSSFCNSDGEPITSNALELYSYVKRSKAYESGNNVLLPVDFVQVPSFAYVPYSSTGNNRLIVDPKVFSDSIDNLLGFTFIKPASIKIATELTTEVIPDETISQALDQNYSTYKNYDYSVFATTDVNIHMMLPELPNNFEFSKLYLGIRIKSSINRKFSFQLKSFKSLNVTYYATDPYGYYDEYWASSGGDGIHGEFQAKEFDSIPDFYYTINKPSTHNKNFYNSPSALTGQDLISGYKNFLIGDISSANYNSYTSIGISIKGGPDPDHDLCKVNIYEIVLIYQTDLNISESVFSSVKGRTWKYPISSSGYTGTDADKVTTYSPLVAINQNDPPESPVAESEFIIGPNPTGDWSDHPNEWTVRGPFNDEWYFSSLPVNSYATLGGSEDQYFFTGDAWVLARKSGLAMIESPVDVYEHVARLQDWKETGDTEDFGKAYSPNALINIGTTEGGFDWVGLDSVRAMKAARQILDYDDCYTDQIMESLCKQYFLCGYQDTAGKECINTIQRLTTTPEVSITLSDIIPGSIGDIEEVSPQNIFCEPEVNFKMNYGSDKFDGHLTVKRVEAATFNASYVTGFTGSEAELVWNMCHALYGHYRMKTKPTSEMTDCHWIRSTEDAKAYLFQWLKWMGAYTDDGSTAKVAVKKRITFKVPYEISMTIGAAHAPWFVSMHFNLTLPHQTGNATMQAIIEEIEFDINDQTTTVKAIIYDVPSEINFYVQKSYDSYESVGWNDIQASVQTKAEAPTNANDIQNSY